ncbi:ABC transporter permease [Streptomyces roseirectus]|uniref:ABC transporter permease n=1 Tax=Streptomyces roseirectus TaxID=2768066 RepID=A0A7H0IGE5_9ACTN|nr:ABC transporter permease [Streptomyces roseirectus]QNP71861.1 ABC transporter permease [Streptomyces roseirectus]
MSTLTVTPRAEAETRTTGGRRAGSVVALARFEAREMLFQIPVLLFAAIYLVLTAMRLFKAEGMNDFPVLHMADRDTQGLPQLFALAVLISANSAVLRVRRDKTAEQFGMLPMEPWRRTLAHVLSIVPFALFTAVVVGIDFTVAALKPGAVGTGSVGELLVGPLTVLAAGIVGILLAGLWPLTFLPVLLLMVAYLTLVGPVVLDGDWSQWFYPVVTDGNSGGIPVPSDLLGRPAGWHALYLAALCALLTCVAMILKGGRTRVVKAATVLALAVTVTAAFGQRPDGGAALAEARRTATEHPEKVQSCKEYGGSTYCSFPEWDGQRGRWAQVVDRVQGNAGLTVPLTVRQRVDVSGGVESDAALSPQKARGDVTIGTRWGGNRVSEFAVGVASVLVAGSEQAAEQLCGARAVTVMWLTLGGEPNPRDTFRSLRIDDSTEGSAVVRTPADPIALTAQQTAVVNELLTRPRAEVTAKVKAHWTELTAPGTSTADAARLLGVQAPKGEETCGE